MAVVDYDSCGDSYASAQLGDLWTTVSGATVVGSGRNGNMISFTNETSVVIRTYGTNRATMVVGLAYKTSSLGSNNAIVTFLDSGNEQMGIYLNSTTGLLEVRKNGALVETSTFAVTLNAWFYIEFKVLFSNTGTYELRVNGNPTPVANNGGAAFDTSATANQFANAVLVRGKQFGTGVFDDFYVDDANFNGDCKVETVSPTGAGTTTGMTPSAGANYTCVDDGATPNDDTDYVSSGTVTTKDTYAMADLVATSGTVYAVKPVIRARKDDAGARSVKSVTRLSATEVQGTEIFVSTSYKSYQPDIATTKPGGGAWAISDVNAMEVGVVVSA